MGVTLEEVIYSTRIETFGRTQKTDKTRTINFTLLFARHVDGDDAVQANNNHHQNQVMIRIGKDFCCGHEDPRMTRFTNPEVSTHIILW